jgi:hypothetical protein
LLTLSTAGSVSYAGDTLHLSAATLVFDAWAPDAVTVVGPAGPVAFVRDGERLRTPTSAIEAPSPRPTLVLEIASTHPTASETRLRLRLPGDTRVRLGIFDVRGHAVATLLDAWRPAGEHLLVWPVRDGRGRRVAPGVYLAVAEAGGMRVSRKVVVTP